MYGHIQRACYFRLIIDRKSFNKILKDCSENKKNDAKEVIEIKLKATEKCKKATSNSNEFIRLIHKDWYIDIGIRKIISEKGYIIQLGKIIDHAKITHTKTVK
jgi:hypothetical protein